VAPFLPWKGLRAQYTPPCWRRHFPSRPPLAPRQHGVCANGLNPSVFRFHVSTLFVLCGSCVVLTIERFRLPGLAVLPPNDIPSLLIVRFPMPAPESTHPHHALLGRHTARDFLQSRFAALPSTVSLFIDGKDVALPLPSPEEQGAFWAPLCLWLDFLRREGRRDARGIKEGEIFVSGPRGARGTREGGRGRRLCSPLLVLCSVRLLPPNSPLFQSCLCSLSLGAGACPCLPACLPPHGRLPSPPFLTPRPQQGARGRGSWWA